MPPLILASSIILFATLFALAIPAGASRQETATPMQQLEPRAFQPPRNEWPSLRFNFTIKRSAMQVHGCPTFSVLASPVVFADNETSGVTSVRYNSFASIAAGPTLYNYTVINGVMLASRSSPGTGNPSAKCVGSAVLPSINSIVSVSSEATAVSGIPTSYGGVGDCLGAQKFRVSVNGLDFGLCVSGSSGFTMYGSDMDVTVEYLDSHVEIIAPNCDTAAECTTTMLPSAVSPMGRSLLTGKMAPGGDVRKLKAEFDFSLEDSCSCKSTPRPCLFVHGLKILAVAKYWGNVVDHAPCCTSTKFAVLDTINISWTDDGQQQKVCDLALGLSETSEGTTISDTIIVTHSMGGLMMAGAIANGKCSLASSSTWVSSAAPMKGSMVSDYFQDSCKGDTNFILDKLVELRGFCPAGPGIQSLAYEGERYGSVELDTAYAAAQEAYRKNVYALMCSSGFSGVLSLRLPLYWTLANVVPHKSDENDGLVEFQSCAAGIPRSEFGDTYRDRFYTPRINHADTAFRSGDSLLNDAKMPVKWFECLL